MTPALAVGDFPRMTHLSVKTLRHYHQVKAVLAVSDAQARNVLGATPDQAEWRTEIGWPIFRADGPS